MYLHWTSFQFLLPQALLWCYIGIVINKVHKIIFTKQPILIINNKFFIGTACEPTSTVSTLSTTAVKTESTPCLTYTFGGNDPGKTCVFPFKYLGRQIYKCIAASKDFTPWCATTNDFDADQKWANCGGNICYNLYS